MTGGASADVETVRDAEGRECGKAVTAGIVEDGGRMTLAAVEKAASTGIILSQRRQRLTYSNEEQGKQ